MEPYTTKTAVEDYLRKNIDDSLNARLTTYIAAMSEHIDNTVGYPVYRATATTRLYDGNNRTSLNIDPVHTITEVQLDGEVVTPLTYPYNSDIKRELRFSLNYFTTGQANVSVTGIHAKAVTLPESISWACTVLVALIMQQLDEKLDGVKSEKIGNYQVTFADAGQRNDYLLAKSIIDSYRSIVF